MIRPTLSVTFTYDHTSGLFEGSFEGTKFQFIAPPDSNIPTKLKNRLHALARHTAADAYERRSINKTPMLSDEEYQDMVETYLLEGGIIQRKRNQQRKPRVTLESLGLTTSDVQDLELDL